MRQLARKSTSEMAPVSQPESPSVLMPKHGFADEQLELLFDRLGTPDIGRKAVRRIRTSPPGRTTKSTRFSGKLRYPSRKMGFVLEAEAFHTEMVAITAYDHDEQTIELYTQPAERLLIRYQSLSGTTVVTYTTTDIFRITWEALIFEECKTEEFLEKACREQPNRYTRGSDGRWRSPPAEAAAEKLGCKFVLRSTRDNNYVLHENLEILEDFYSAEEVRCTEAAKKVLEERLRGRPFVSTHELVHHEPAICADDLYAAIFLGEVYFPLHALRLTDQEQAFVFRSQQEWRAHEKYLSSDRPDDARPCSGRTFRKAMYSTGMV